ncbi:MAG: hypothetical protein ACOYNL_11305 [Rickettsiales bacterium]
MKAHRAGKNMQEFSLAFGRVSRSAIAANPELKAHVVDLLARAYHNIHGQNFANADPAWARSITAAGLQLSLDERVRSLSPRETIQLFENVIRISEEHLREARRHAAMANNVFYLKETALDASIISSGEAVYHSAEPMVLGGSTVAHSGRVEVPKPGEPIA